MPPFQEEKGDPVERSASRIFRPRRFAVLQCVVVLASVLVAVVGSSSIVQAKTCYSGNVCHYHAIGESGWGSNGTAIDIQIPTSVWTYNTYDGVAFNAFIVNVGGSSALEAGTVFGWMDYCNTALPAFIPYGTKDDGQTESANCGMYLAPNGNYYWARAFKVSGRGYSRIENGSQQNLWQKDWGNYDPGYALNETTAEVWQDAASYPTWAGSVNMFHGSWLDNNNHWNYWTFTNVSDDCPYHAVKYSPDAWQASSSC